MSDKIQPLKYIPAFDGVRGVFCLLIISHHWVMPYLKGPFALLWWILQLFFILSAYLISKILLYDKQRLDFKSYTKRFFTRRAYRIFPLYFIYLFVIGGFLLLAGTSEAGAQNPDVRYFKENWGYLFTYTYNFAEIGNYFRGVDYHPSALFSHLWSLSLEEQFYFIFPFVIFFLSIKNLKRLIIAVILLGPLVRVVAYQTLQGIHDEPEWLGLIAVRNTFFQLDTLAYGMAIAVFDIDKIKRPVMWFGIILAAWFAAAFTSAWFIVDAGEASGIRAAMSEYIFMTKHHNYVTFFTLSNIMCAAFVLCIVKGSVLNKFFENRVLCYLGKVSYGMYVYHYFVMLLAAGILGSFMGPHTKYIGNFPAEVFMFTFYIGLLVLISHVSYKYIEMYFLKLKERV